MENPMSVKRVFYQIIRVKQYNHEVINILILKLFVL